MLKARNGYWQAHLILPSGKRVRSSTGIAVAGGDKAAAWAEHDRIEREALAQVRPAGEGPTLQDAFDTAMDEHEPWRASTSPRTIEGNFKAVSGYFTGDRAVASIGDTEVAAYKKHMLGLSLSPSTVNQRLSMLSILFAQSKVKRPEIKRAKVRKGHFRILSKHEESLVLEYFTEAAQITKDRQGRERKLAQARDLDMIDLVAVLLDTGFRLGEMLRVGTDEVSFERNTIAAWETKGDEPRNIPMTKRVRAVMTRRLAAPATKAFPLLTVDSADDAWVRCREALGLTADVQFVIHALRHTCCSRMVAAGMDAFRVQKWMGHKNIATTQRYVTLDVSDLMGLAGALECATERATGPQIKAGESAHEVAPQSEATSAQPVESNGFRTVNPQVPGSSPGRGANTKQGINELASPPDAEEH